ncbi:MAG TPA: cytochrome c peroxidase [Stenotrophobium sp.]|jgi:cytochrome c peroxidase|nr:cytochrome c peroxidase [Stenotrophobium sp.]
MSGKIFTPTAKFTAPAATALLAFALVACSQTATVNSAATTPANGNASPVPSALDQQLRQLIVAHGLTGDPSRGRNLPDINSPMAQLGMRLFFSRSLGGTFEVACASCHAPALAGTDQLSLAVGTGANDPSLVGPGRSTASGLPLVGRNAPTTFNTGFADHFLFLDGRIASLTPTPGANGSAGAIRTPDSAFGQPDPLAGSTLPAAQSRFPIVTPEEMRGDFLSGADNETVRQHLAARLGDYGVAAGELPQDQWLPLFQAAFGVAGDAPSLITDANIAEAIAAYERSQVFVDNPWRDYVGGNLGAIDDSAKRGAILFLTPANQGGASCSGCHSGDTFSDERFHDIAIPQIGPGKGDGPQGDDDFGRFRESGDPNDRYAFRTPSLLNIALTAPYDHDGAFATLQQVLDHYRDPQGSVDHYFSTHAWCALAQFSALPAAQCQSLYPHGAAHTQAALAQLQANRGTPLGLPAIKISDAQVADLISFMNALTDRCAVNRSCVSRWQPPRDGGPDGHQLAPLDQHGNPL